MSEISVVEVTTRRQRKAFIKFPNTLYAGCPYYVPALNMDEFDTLSPGRNPAFESGEARLFMAYRGETAVGRVAALLSRSANAKHNRSNVRFGWFDSVNDIAVAAALLGAVERWARMLGMDTITGPMGFNEFDKAGMLLEGFDSMPTMATYYNYPYYNELMESFGFVKEIDTVEYLVTGFRQGAFPQRLERLTQWVKRRAGYRVLHFNRKKDLLGRADEIFALIDESYSDLCDSVPLSAKQQAYYIKKFFPFLNKDLVKAVANPDGEMVGFFIAMPSLSRALRKANGRLFPFGFIHLLRAFRAGQNDTVDFLLAGVKPNLRGKGVDVVMAEEMFNTVARLGFKYAEANPELETNLSVRGEWRHFEHVQHRRRRIYVKPITESAKAALSGVVRRSEAI